MQGVSRAMPALRSEDQPSSSLGYGKKRTPTVAGCKYRFLRRIIFHGAYGNLAALGGVP
jgi:hypothetical protein